MILGRCREKAPPFLVIKARHNLFWSLKNRHCLFSTIKLPSWSVLHYPSNIHPTMAGRMNKGSLSLLLIKNDGMSKFDDMARTWDENPMHMERSLAIAAKMNEILPLGKQMKGLEYGAGTGILSFLLSEKLGSIVMMDNSEEMVNVMKEKVAARKATNLIPVCFNLENDLFQQTFDLIFNQMVLHHITDVESIFTKFFTMILPGGSLAIADLYPEDGSFHGDGFDGHPGFDPEELKIQLLKTGFKRVAFEECYQVKRQTAKGVTKSYPVFLIVATK